MTEKEPLRSLTIDCGWTEEQRHGVFAAPPARLLLTLVGTEEDFDLFLRAVRA